MHGWYHTVRGGIVEYMYRRQERQKGEQELLDTNNCWGCKVKNNTESATAAGTAGIVDLTRAQQPHDERGVTGGQQRKQSEATNWSFSHSLTLHILEQVLASDELLLFYD